MSTAGMNRRAAVGALWTQGAFLLGKLIVFATTVILARLLAPEDFGLVAMGLVVLAFLDAAADLGSGAAIVWRPDQPERTAAVSMSVALAGSVVVTLATFFAAPGIAAAFNEPRAADIVRVLSVAFLLAAPASVFSNLLLRRLEYRRRVIPDIAKTIAKGAVSITLAVLGFGVWSLVLGHLAGLAVGLVVVWRLAGWRPRLSLDRGVAREVLRFGIQITLLSLLGAAIKNFDQLIVGARLGAAALGIYVVAFSIIEQVVMSICWAANQALFPLFSARQGDPDAVRSTARDSLGIVAALTFPAAGGLLVVAGPFVELFFGEKWRPAVPVMQALAVYALVYSASFNLGDVYKGTGRPEILTRIALVNLAVSIPVLLFAATWGIFGVAIGQIVVALAITAVNWFVAWRVIGLTPGMLYEALKGPSLALLVMLVACALADLLLPFQSAVVRLAVLVLVGVVAYLVSLLLSAPAVLRKGIALILPRSKPEAG